MTVQEVASAAFLPPPGTDPAVQSLYYADIAGMTYDVTKGVTSGAVKLADKSIVVSRDLLGRIGIKGFERYAYTQSRNAVGASKSFTGLKMLRPIKAGLQSAKAAIQATKWGSRAITLLETLDTGPVGLVLDAIMIGMMVYGLIFDTLDKSGIDIVLTPENIKQTVNQMTSVTNDAYAKAGLPDYFYGQAEFPLTDLIFQWDDKTKSYTTTPEWGPMYSGLMDKYMKTQGFDKNWRNNVDTGNSSSSSSTLLKILVIVGVFLFFMIFLGVLFFVISN